MADIDEARRKAMSLLEREAGGPVAAAKRAGMGYAQWVNLRSGAADSRTGKPRGMRKQTARKIESAFGRDEGWLDYADLVEDLDVGLHKSDVEFELVKEAWAVAGPNSRIQVLTWARATLAAYRDKGRS
ncbi:MAG: hypothetical protein EPN31_06195 [Castellaniella sp.]|uniref:hypothetical protein n=1 Tax=Castellaniella sp. TaxID=1955812 RepID=UPI001219647F|nr:hypothetical protein [Castellaniella sp.]TAN29573.1 MAG: hypothetical protein EPN31_06195 [Castellaniella sp.]